MRDLTNRDESNLCCWGKVHVSHAGLIIAIFAFKAAVFDLLFLSVPVVGSTLIVFDLAAGSAGIYAFCSGSAWAWLPLMILNIVKTVLFAVSAFFALIVQLLLCTVYSKARTEDEKQLERMILIVGSVIIIGYVLAACLFAWFARLAHRAFVWQRNDGLPSYQSCVTVNNDV